MPRKIKNVIMIILLVISLGCLGGTMYYAKTYGSSNETSMISSSNAPGGTPPSMPNNNTSDGSSNNSENSSNNNTPPEKPDGDNNSQNDTPPSMPNNDSNSSSNSNGNTPPAKPDENNNSSNSDSSDASASNMPNNNNSNSNGGMMPPDMSNNKNKTTFPTIYYVLFGIEGIIIAIIVMYLILSKFNKNNLKETFCSKDKVIIYILASIIFAASIMLCLAYITNNYLLESNDNKPTSQMPGGNSNVSYSSAKEITKDTTITSGSYESTKADQNALLVSGDIKANISDITVNKTGDSDGGDSTSFYGMNSAILAKDGAILDLKNIKVTTNATGANGVFSYGGSATTDNSKSDGTTVNISDSEIITSKNNSGGIMTTGGGVMNATNLTINTAGTSSAAIRSDRGGGKVNVNKGVYNTTGQGSPVIYSTADITVKNAKLVATKSEGVVIEGKNSVTLENVDLTDTNNTLNGQSTTYKNIFLYQSMSGDAASGNSKFTSKDSNIVTNKGDTFYVTNTSSEITLENNTITNNDKSGNFLRAKADSWGNNGSNGGNVILKMINQKAEGNIVIDKISSLDMTMKDGSNYKGTINGNNSAKSIKLTLDKNSKITLTGNSYVTSLDNADSSNSNIDFNGYKLYVNGKAIN